MGNQTRLVIVIIVMAILLIGAIAYIVYGFYQQKQLQSQMVAYQNGLQAGYEQAVYQLIQQAVTCQQVPIRVGNQSLNIIAVDCLTPSNSAGNVSG